MDQNSPLPGGKTAHTFLRPGGSGNATRFGSPFPQPPQPDDRMLSPDLPYGSPNYSSPTQWMQQQPQASSSPQRWTSDGRSSTGGDAVPESDEPAIRYSGDGDDAGMDSEIEDIGRSLIGGSNSGPSEKEKQYEAEPTSNKTGKILLMLVLVVALAGWVVLAADRMGWTRSSNDPGINTNKPHLSAEDHAELSRLRKAESNHRSDLLKSMDAIEGVRVPAVFANHMVLQKEHATIWGWTEEPSISVTVALSHTTSVGGETAEFRSGTDGFFKHEFNPYQSSNGWRLSIIVGTNKPRTFEDVSFGEVVMCAGELSVATTLSANPDLVAAPMNVLTKPNVRFFLGKPHQSHFPSDVVHTMRVDPWISGGKNANDFVKDLHPDWQVPAVASACWKSYLAGATDKDLAGAEQVGLILLAAPGGSISAFASHDALVKCAPLNTPSAVPPSALYNGVIHPLLPLRVKSVTWFGNVVELGGIQCRFKSFLEDWRHDYLVGRFDATSHSWPICLSEVGDRLKTALKDMSIPHMYYWPAPDPEFVALTAVPVVQTQPVRPVLPSWFPNFPQGEKERQQQEQLGEQQQAPAEEPDDPQITSVGFHQIQLPPLAMDQIKEQLEKQRLQQQQAPEVDTPTNIPVPATNPTTNPASVQPISSPPAPIPAPAPVDTSPALGPDGFPLDSSVQTLPGVPDSEDTPFQVSLPAYGKDGTPCFYLFPRPKEPSSFFITAKPNHGAGVGHEFGEWVQGVYWSSVLGLHYLHTPFGVHARQWNGFWGWGVGEDTLEDFHASYPQGLVLVRNATDERDSKEHLGEWMQRTMMEMKTHTHPLSKQIAATAAADGKPTQDQPSNMQLKALDPLVPNPVLFFIDLIHVSKSYVVCEQRIYATMRRKYCLARIKDPVPVDLYKRDRPVSITDPHYRTKHKIVLAFHLRCGDGCWSEYRTTPFASVMKTAIGLREALATLEPEREVSIHIFSQKPHNMTAAAYFKPLTDDLQRERFQVTTHFETHSHTTYHHLVVADVLIGSQSSFSWVAALMHYTVSLTPMTSCFHGVPYNKQTGVFDQAIFLREWANARGKEPRFDSIADCESIKEEKSVVYQPLAPRNPKLNEPTKPHLIVEPQLTPVEPAKPTPQTVRKSSVVQASPITLPTPVRLPVVVALVPPVPAPTVVEPMAPAPSVAPVIAPPPVPATIPTPQPTTLPIAVGPEQLTPVPAAGNDNQPSA